MNPLLAALPPSAGLAERVTLSYRGARDRGHSVLVCELDTPASRERPFEPYGGLRTAVNGPARRIALYTIGETWSLPE